MRINGKLSLSEALGQRILVTTDAWFFAPDGKQYTAIVGTYYGVANTSDVLGIKVNARSVDWFLRVGRMLIAGCKVHFVALADECEVNTGGVEDWTQRDSAPYCVGFSRPTKIYDADAK